MPGMPDGLGVRDPHRHQHRCHHEAGHEVVPQPGPLVVPQHDQPRNPALPADVCRVLGWTVDSARDGMHVVRRSISGYLFASRMRAVIWSMYVITPTGPILPATPGDPPARLPLWNNVTSTRTGDGWYDSLAVCMRGQEHVVPRHAHAFSDRRGLDVHVDIRVIVGVPANMQAGVGQMLVDLAFEDRLHQTAARGLRAQIFDDKADGRNALELGAGLRIDGIRRRGRRRRLSLRRRLTGGRRQEL